MSDLEKAQEQLKGKGITTNIENGCLYVCIDDVQLELAEYEVEYQARIYDVQNEGMYNHAVDVAFEVITENEEPTIQEMLEGMEKRLQYLKDNHDEAREAFGLFDTFETEQDES